MRREDSFWDIHEERPTEEGSEFLGTKHCMGVNISGRTALMLTLERNGRAPLFCGTLRGWLR
jgi:hypothetical protein